VKTILAASLIGFFTLAALAQTGPGYTIKSWETGIAQAEPQTLNISLSTSDRIYRKVINDVSGHPLYRLLVRPAAFIGPGDGIVAWHVYLTTLDGSANLLIPSDSLEQEEYERPDYLWWFYPGKNRLVPIETPRVVHLEGSYVLLKAGDVKLNAAGQLEGMQLTIQFSNAPPRKENGSGK
jgi:hypothetical protein